jgi:hypothetical protein
MILIQLTTSTSKESPICPICEFRPRAGRSAYCVECGKFIIDKPEPVARAAAMVAARRPLGKYWCYYLHIEMDLSDSSSPRYPNFDHRTPGKKGDLVMCCAFINEMKGAMAEDEFWAVVIAYVDHLDGKPFPPEVARLKYWKATKEGPALRLAMIPRPLKTNAPFCEICGEKPLPRAKYCAVCSRIVYHAGENLARVAGLKRARNKELKVFICRYTGLVIVLDDTGSPLYINFDHVKPGVKGRLEAVVAFINRMKTAMTKREFDRVMRELARFRREGGKFDELVIDFKYWRKVIALVARMGVRAQGRKRKRVKG